MTTPSDTPPLMRPNAMTTAMLFLTATTAMGQPPPNPPDATLASDHGGGALRERTVVRYQDFGAIGDGVADDFDAIIAAHAYANQHGVPVLARDGAKYYIGGGKRTAVVQTDTDLSSAEFIIDDTKVPAEDAGVRGAPVFRVCSALSRQKLEGVTTLAKNQSKLGVSLPYPSLVSVRDANVRHFIRRGLNQNSGAPQTDLFLVDRDGNVDPGTPILWDFATITELTAYPVDAATLTVRGGRFTTIANAAESKYTYYHRGIRVERSKVVVAGLEHRVIGEGPQGAPYSGFISIGDCAHVTVSNSLFTARKTYRTIGSAGSPVSMGSYDIQVSRAVNVAFVNCTQTNDIKDNRLWGIMASNYSKNLSYDGCTLSRFDAHCGLLHGSIRNSTVRVINLTGWGTFTIENSTVIGAPFISLRSDYGSTWQGDIVIRNSTWSPGAGKPIDSLALIVGSNDGQHDFGHPCHMPQRILVSNLRIEDEKRTAKYSGPAVLGDFNRRLKGEGYVEAHPYVKTQEVVLENVTTASGLDVRLSDNPFMFQNVRVTGLD